MSLHIPIIQERAMKVTALCSQACSYADVAQITIITNLLLRRINQEVIVFYFCE